MGDQVAEERADDEALRQGRGDRVGVARRDLGERRGRRLPPLPPGAPGQLEEDLLAGLEIAQQCRLVDADSAGDVGEGDLADAVAFGQLRRGGEDRLAPLLLLLGTAGALEGLPA